MIPNQPYVQQTAVMPDYYQQNLMSPNQAEINKPAENVTAPMTHYNCCVDVSHMHHFHDMHGFHHMLDYHHMHDVHPYSMHESWDPHMHESWDPHMHESWDPHMHGSWDPHMHESWDPHMHGSWDPHMHGSWDPHMHDDPHDGWEMTSMDYHHEWFHPHHMHHMHYMHHPMCYPVVCYPAEKEQKGKP